jgi:hypothetical protein
MKWIKVKDTNPERIGNYLVYTDRGYTLVAFVNVLGQWSVVPGAVYYGDMLKFGNVIAWMPLPKIPKWLKV